MKKERTYEVVIKLDGDITMIITADSFGQAGAKAITILEKSLAPRDDGSTGIKAVLVKELE